MDGYKNEGWYRNQNCKRKRELERLRQATGATPGHVPTDQRSGSSGLGGGNDEDGGVSMGTGIAVDNAEDRRDLESAASGTEKANRMHTAEDIGEQTAQLTRRQRKKIAYLAHKTKMREARNEAIDAAQPGLVDRTRCNKQN